MVSALQIFFMDSFLGQQHSPISQNSVTLDILEDSHHSNPASTPASQPNRPYVILLLSLHILTYLLHFFKKRDIRLYGSPDLNGVYTSRRQQLISNIETFIICIIVGFTVKHLWDMDHDEFSSEGYRTYFIIFDSVITFLYKPYIYFGLVIKTYSETTKNLYTLFHTQAELIRGKEKTQDYLQALLTRKSSLINSMLRFSSSTGAKK